MGSLGTLQSVLEQRKSLSASESVEIVRRLAEVVRRCHADGNVHRAIHLQAVSIDPASGGVELAPAAAEAEPFGGPHSDPERCPAELRSLPVVPFPDAALEQVRRRTSRGPGNSRLRRWALDWRAVAAAAVLALAFSGVLRWNPNGSSDSGPGSGLRCLAVR